MLDIGSLTFQWPAMLWLLAAVPALVAAYGWLIGRRKRFALQYASLSLAGDATSAAGRLRRHLPAALLLLGLAAMIVAVARPHAALTLPVRQEAIILAMDVSGSMRATDIKPNRLAAAQNAAKAFVNAQPRHVRIGVVAIAGAAAVVQSPTEDREEIFKAIDRFQLQRGSAIGTGLVIALSAALPDAGIDVEQIVFGRGSRPWLRDPAPKPTEPEPVPPGSNASAAIVLLSDGQANTGFDPLEAAKLAAKRGVRIFTVGVGTTEGTTLGFEGWSMRVRLDEDTLKKIAATTHGEYFHAANATALHDVYRHLTTRLVLEKKRATEVTAVFVGLGAALAMLGALLSLFWFNRIL